jgi:hypothetical protein
MSDVTEDWVVEPAEALEALEAMLKAEPGRAEEVARDRALIITGKPHITPGGLLQIARALEESEPTLARQCRERAELRASEAHERLKARGLVS